MEDEVVVVVSVDQSDVTVVQIFCDEVRVDRSVFLDPLCSVVVPEDDGTEKVSSSSAFDVVDDVTVSVDAASGVAPEFFEHFASIAVVAGSGGSFSFDGSSEV